MEVLGFAFDSRHFIGCFYGAYAALSPLKDDRVNAVGDKANNGGKMRIHLDYLMVTFINITAFLPINLLNVQIKVDRI